MIDEGYFFFLEETDWCHRIRAAGWRIVHLPDAYVIHLYGESTKKKTPLRTRIEYYRSRYLFFRKNRSRAAYRRAARDRDGEDPARRRVRRAACRRVPQDPRAGTSRARTRPRGCPGPEPARSWGQTLEHPRHRRRRLHRLASRRRARGRGPARARARLARSAGPRQGRRLARAREPEGRVPARRRARPRGRAVARSTASRWSTTRPRPSASRSRCTRSRRTCRRTRSAPAPCCRRWSRARTRSSAWWWRRRCRSTARAPTSTPTESPPRPGLRPDAQLEKHEWELRDERGRALRAARHARDQAAATDFGVRRDQARPRGAVPRGRQRVPHSDRRAALLQRVRLAPGALESVHRRRGDLQLAAAQPQAAARHRGRPAVARLRARLRHRAREPAGAALRRGRRARVQRRHRPTDDDPAHRRAARGAARARDRARDHRALPRRRHPPLLRRSDARAAHARLRGEGRGSRTASTR